VQHSSTAAPRILGILANFALAVAMPGCLPFSLKRLLDPHAPRPYLPVDEPAALKTAVPASRSSAGTRSTRAKAADTTALSSSARSSSDGWSVRRDGKRTANLSQQQYQHPHQSQNSQRGPRSATKKHPAPKARGESRPTGLFAAGPPPLRGQENAAHHRQHGGPIDQRNPTVVPAAHLAGMGMERSRHHVDYPSSDPAWAPPAGWIVTSGRGYNARPGPSRPSTRPSREALRGQNTHGSDAALVAALVELPGSFSDVPEKEAVGFAMSPSVRTMASFDTLDTAHMQSVSGRPSQLDSVIELPGSFPVKPHSRGSSSFAVELPGSSPEVMEIDGGPLPPAEMMGSIPGEHVARASNV